MSKQFLGISLFLVITACTKTPAPPLMDVDGVLAQAADQAVIAATHDAEVAMAKDSTAALADSSTPTD